MDGFLSPIAKMTDNAIKGEVSNESSDTRCRLGKECLPAIGVRAQRACGILVRRVRREQLLKVLRKLKPCLIGIEASIGAFYWLRQFEKLGRSVKIMAP
jgi:hypothetical protein